jgi:hypothetical protein
VPLAGSAIVAIWNDITPELRDAFFEWHPREHMVERLGVPGFLRGSRYIAIDAEIEFFTLYEAPEIDVFVSPAYKERLNTPTPWSLQVLPGFRNNIRGVCRVLFSCGIVDGGFVSTIRFGCSDANAADVTQALCAAILPPVLDMPRITGVHLAVCDQALSGTNTSLQRGRVITTPDCIVLIEGSDGPHVREASIRVTEALRRSGGEAPVTGLYQREYSLSRLTAAEQN